MTDRDLRDDGSPKTAADADHPPDRLIEVFADVSCPFTHVSLRRFCEMRRQAGADHVWLRVRAWPLELIDGEPLGPDKAAEEVADLRAQVAPDLFRGFDSDVLPSATVGVLGAATLAYDHGAAAGEAFNLALREALFEHGRAVGDPAVLAEIAGRLGVPVPDAAAARSAVEADLADGRRRGVAGSPHFFVAGESFFCPMLDIQPDGQDGHLRIAVDQGQLERFAGLALR